MLCLLFLDVFLFFFTKLTCQHAKSQIEPSLFTILLHCRKNWNQLDVLSLNSQRIFLFFFFKFFMLI